MAFLFRLQAVLDESYACEANARGVLVEARMCYDAIAVRRAEVASAIAEHRVCRIAFLREHDPAFAASEASIVALEAFGAKLSRDLVRGSALLARARSIYEEASKKRLALERLRERRFDDYEMRRALDEAAQLDESNALLARADAVDEALSGNALVDEAAFDDVSKAGGVITLHRMNGQPLIVNADLIETVERTGEDETAIVLTTGNVLVVTEPPEAVRAAAIAFRRSISSPGP